MTILAGIISANTAAYVEGQAPAYGLLNAPLLDAPGLNDFYGRFIDVAITDARVGDNLTLASSTTVNIGSGANAATALVTVDGTGRIFVQVTYATPTALLVNDSIPVDIGTMMDMGASLRFSLTSGFPSDARVTALLEAITFSSTSEDPNGNLTNANDVVRDVRVTLSNLTGTAIEETATMQISVDDVNDAIVPVGTTTLIPLSITEAANTGASAVAA